jgi:hypothetical protein
MFCVEVWTVVPLVGSRVVCCEVRWPVVVCSPAALVEVMLLLLEEVKLKEEVMVELEDIVGFVVVGVWWGLVVVDVVVGGWWLLNGLDGLSWWWRESKIGLERSGIYLELEPRSVPWLVLLLLRIVWNVQDLWPPMMSLCDGVGEH